MNRYPKVGETVQIMNDIGKDFVDDMIATVEQRDGDYIYVRTLKKRVLIERYPNELEPYPPEAETATERSKRLLGLYEKEPGITREYKVAEYGTAARVRTSHLGVELWRYRFSWDANSAFRDIDAYADAFTDMDDFIDYAEMQYIIGERRRK